MEKVNYFTSTKSDSTINYDNKRTDLLGWVRFFSIIFLLIFFFRFAISITFINGNSMNPTLEDNNLVITSNIFYEIERNDIVIVRDHNGFDIIKRIIAVPGETVAIKNGIVFVNGEPIKETFIVGTSSDMQEIKVSEGYYFIMGDNRTPGESLDSRSSEIGPVSELQIKGEAFLSIYPIGLL